MRRKKIVNLSPLTEYTIIDPEDARKLMGGHTIIRRSLMMYQAICGLCHKTVGPETEKYDEVFIYLNAHKTYKCV